MLWGKRSTCFVITDAQNNRIVLLLTGFYFFLDSLGHCRLIREKVILILSFFQFLIPFHYSSLCVEEVLGNTQHLLSEDHSINELQNGVFWLIFTARAMLCAVYAMAILSVTSQCSTKMAKHRNTQTTPHNSQGL